MKSMAIILESGLQSSVFPDPVRRQMDSLGRVTVENVDRVGMKQRAEDLASVEILFTGWGAPLLDEETLSLLPKVKAVFYAAGSIRSIVTDEFWDRNIPICSARGANAVPVAEFCLAQVILALKQVHRFPALMRQARNRAWPEGFDQAGAYDSTVSLISLGQIGQRVAERLQSLDVRLFAFDPLCPAELIDSLGIERRSLEECFSLSRVVSLHTPCLPETEGMITGDLIESMPLGATLINSARGALIREDEMIQVLRHRQDLTAILDVTWPDPPAEGSPLYEMPNVFLTPHIAGSEGRERGRLGHTMVEECRRFLQGKPLCWQITRDTIAQMA